jgi:hypothetical protein
MKLKAQREAAFQAARDSWWERLTSKAKNAIMRRGAEKSKRQASLRALRSAGVTGYVCPKCWKRHPTPEERRECRAGHAA